MITSPVGSLETIVEENEVMDEDKLKYLKNLTRFQKYLKIVGWEMFDGMIHINSLLSNKIFAPVDWTTMKIFFNDKSLLEAVISELKLSEKASNYNYQMQEKHIITTEVTNMLFEGIGSLDILHFHKYVKFVSSPLLESPMSLTFNVITEHSDSIRLDSYLFLLLIIRTGIIRVARRHTVEGIRSLNSDNTLIKSPWQKYITNYQDNLKLQKSSSNDGIYIRSSVFAKFGHVKFYCKAKDNTRLEKTCSIHELFIISDSKSCNEFEKKYPFYIPKWNISEEE